MGRLRRLAERLTSPEHVLESEELRSQTADVGCTPISEVTDRSIVRCRGVIRSVSLRPRSESVPALVVDLDDGPRTMNLVWLGRRTIAGIDPGVFVTVHGRVCMRHGVPTMFNPAYELRAAAGH